jgi:hypothetical protein
MTMKKLMVLLLLALSIVGCSNSTQNIKNQEDFVFTYNQEKISVGDDTADFIATLGTYNSLSTAPSCAFDGDDTVYDYPGFQLTTYQNKGVEILTGVYLLDSSISTSEDIKIGSTQTEVLQAYGDDYTEEYGVITYIKNKTELSFVIIKEVVTSISYIHIVE